MTEAGLRFVVHGKPRPKGSMEAVGPYGRGGMKEDNPESGPWREAVKWAAHRAMRVSEDATGVPFTPLDGPVQVDVVFSFTKPTGAPKRRRTWPVTRSTYDVDKLQRNIGDALQDVGVLVDDARIVRWVAEKAYCGEPPSQMATPGAAIAVRPFPEGEQT